MIPRRTFAAVVIASALCAGCGRDAGEAEASQTCARWSSDVLSPGAASPDSRRTSIDDALRSAEQAAAADDRFEPLRVDVSAVRSSQSAVAFRGGREGLAEAENIHLFCTAEGLGGSGP